MKRMIALIMFAVCMHIAADAQAADAPFAYKKGDRIEDFIFTTFEGESHSLYEILAEKDAVLLNIWASWCGPCKSEFPYMQEAYLEYQDRVEIIALSCETTDTHEKLADFAARYGLTFEIGQDTVNFLSALGMGSIPTSVMIDRYGTICYIEAGAQTDVDSFRRLFEVFLGNDYAESILLDGIPAEKPNVKPSSETELTEALGSTARNADSQFIWPMTVTKIDGRTVVKSTNTNQASTRAEVIASVTARGGEAIVVTFKTSTEAIYDMLSISINGKTVKSFGGEHGWTTYAIPVEANGEYTVKIAYTKDSVVDCNEDAVWIDSISVVSDAANAIAANPSYPVADSTTLHVTNPSAREVTISDPGGILTASFGAAQYYIINSDTATMKALLSVEKDPETAFFYFSYGNRSQIGLTQTKTETGYEAKTTVDSAETTKTLCTYAVLYLDATGKDRITALLFKDEDNLNAFVQNNGLGQWEYIQNEPDATAEQTIVTESNSTVKYTFKCVDQDGNPVKNVMIQVCDEVTCQVLITDENGICTFGGKPYAWEIHILRAPAGYRPAASEENRTPIGGGEIVFTFIAE